MNKLSKHKGSIYDVIMIGIGGLLAATGILGFLIPSGFFDGGATGLAMLGSAITPVPLNWCILIINIPFLMIGWNRFGTKFITKCLISIIYFSILVAVISVPELSHDKILCSVFGGILLGAGIGFAVNGGGVLDGTEIVAIILCQRLGISIGTLVLIFNIVVFSLVALLRGYETALYSILTYIFASKSANFLIHGIEEYIGISIVSSASEKIRKTLLDELNLGVTIYNGKTGLADKEQDILFCVITKYDMQRVKNIIKGIDEKAFIVMQPVENTFGGLVKSKLRRKKHF